MDEMKQSLEDMKIKYVSCRNEKEYAITIDHMKYSSENYLEGSDSYGSYLGIDLVTGEITGEELDDGIPQPYTAGTATLESLQMVKETFAAEKRRRKNDGDSRRRNEYGTNRGNEATHGALGIAEYASTGKY